MWLISKRKGLEKDEGKTNSTEIEGVPKLGSEKGWVRDVHHEDFPSITALPAVSWLSRLLYCSQNLLNCSRQGFQQVPCCQIQLALVSITLSFVTVLFPSLCDVTFTWVSTSLETLLCLILLMKDTAYSFLCHGMMWVYQ